MSRFSGPQGGTGSKGKGTPGDPRVPNRGVMARHRAKLRAEAETRNAATAPERRRQARRDAAAAA